jgi:hypothetical protein
MAVREDELDEAVRKDELDAFLMAVSDQVIHAIPTPKLTVHCPPNRPPVSSSIGEFFLSGRPLSSIPLSDPTAISTATNFHSPSLAGGK